MTCILNFTQKEIEELGLDAVKYMIDSVLERGGDGHDCVHVLEIVLTAGIVMLSAEGYRANAVEHITARAKGYIQTRGLETVDPQGNIERAINGGHVTN